MRSAIASRGMPLSAARRATRCFSVRSSSIKRLKSASMMLFVVARSGSVSGSDRATAPSPWRLITSSNETSRHRLRRISANAVRTQIFCAQTVKRLSPLKESRLSRIFNNASCTKSSTEDSTPPVLPRRAALRPRTSRTRRSASAASLCVPRKAASHSSLLRSSIGNHRCRACRPSGFQLYRRRTPRSLSKVRVWPVGASVSVRGTTRRRQGIVKPRHRGGSKEMEIHEAEGASGQVVPQEGTPGYQPIENYGIIGDLHTTALVGMDGSIDWLCLPRHDSPSVFGAILDDARGGRFKISPDMEGTTCKQLYWPDTNVLVTRFFTPDGVG